MFTLEKFISHSGKELDWKIECDDLTDEDLDTIAYIISKKINFRLVYGVPRGGIKLASKLNKYRDHTSNNVLIIDDVLTTGNSMNESKQLYQMLHPDAYIFGVVIFSRGRCPPWITSVFKLNEVF